MSNEPGDSAALAEEIERLRRRVDELERDVARSRDAEAALRERLLEQSALLNELPASVFLKDREHRYLVVNKTFVESFGLSPQEIIGKTDFEIFPPETARTYHANDEGIMASGEPRRNVELLGVRTNGAALWTLESHIPRRDQHGEVVGLLSVLIDVTDHKEAEASLRKTEAELRAALAQKEQMLTTIIAMSAPVLPIYQGILVLPLMGHIDADRSSRVVEALLRSVERHAAAYVIVDLTGVPLVDATIAEHLVRAAKAIGLLGARCILVGMSPDIARTLAHLGIDLNEIMTLSDLQAGMRYALGQLGHEIRRITR